MKKKKKKQKSHIFYDYALFSIIYSSLISSFIITDLSLPPSIHILVTSYKRTKARAFWIPKLRSKKRTPAENGTRKQVSSDRRDLISVQVVAQPFFIHKFSPVKHGDECTTDDR